MSSQEKSQKDRSMLLALLLFIGAAVLIFMSLGSDKRKSASHASDKTKTTAYQNAVNRHLMITNEKMAMEKKRAAVDAFNTENQFQNSAAQKGYQRSNNLDLSTDERGYQIAEDLGRGVRQEDAPSTPDEVVQAELYAQEQQNQYNEAYREEYARQFIENARRGGYRVKLSEDLSRVISVTPIRNPSGGDTRYSGGAAQ